MARVMAASPSMSLSLPLIKDCSFVVRFNSKGWHVAKDEGKLISGISKTIPSNLLPSGSFQSVGIVINALKYHQNVDLPPVLPKRKKKPYPRPIKEIIRDARKIKKRSKLEEAKMEERVLGPPENGLLVPDLIPVAHQVLEARKILVKNLVKLLDVIPVFACRYCSNVHVGFIGNEIRDCQGSGNGARNSSHVWIKGCIDGILVPIETFHLFDRLGKRISHNDRFNVDSIPAVVELCIQAGVDLPEYPTRRRKKPLHMIGKKVVDPNVFVDEPKQTNQAGLSEELDPCGIRPQTSPPPLSSQEIQEVAETALQAFDTMRGGVCKLLKKYPVKACGYCPEVHVGPLGHRVRLCGAFKHQWRDGKHGWQEATVDELIPPQYVYHVRDLAGPPLMNHLRRFYGQAPAIVELCVQAGAAIPERFKPMMRVDIAIPDSQEAEMVA
ncbi:hypothetical protein SUGI_0790490 [Cryptomeria japonica]|uniref:APO protein 1, chloroplastic n=1 Tax=Cryptomeria japonica TaxID=3369 RepID=UPI002414A894|nr:APO protein 1, chloroplastic [Cryptomeria japonica]GLJ38772.1 hypothetical protein SUGI_0790490 [Cryptomeria japonica]